MGVGNNELPGESELTDTWGTQHNKRARRQTEQATLVEELTGAHQMSVPHLSSSSLPCSWVKAKWLVLANEYKFSMSFSPLLFLISSEELQNGDIAMRKQPGSWLEKSMESCLWVRNKALFVLVMEISRITCYCSTSYPVLTFTSLQEFEIIN